MPNSWFQFKQFRIDQGSSAMKVTTDACLFGAWVAEHVPLFTGSKLRLLDIGAGTGLLSLMVAQRLAEIGKSFAIDAIEIEPAAAAQAIGNIIASPWFDSIRVIAGNITGHHEGPYDIIFSNPPFYQGQLNSPDAGRRLAHHDGGLSLQQLLVQLENLLSSDGSFYLLLPFSRKKEALDMIADAGLRIDDLIEVRPSMNHKPFRLLMRGRRSGLSSSNEMLPTSAAIRDTDETYTEWFKGLLKNYYLGL